jgi:hypothetical protein
VPKKQKDYLMVLYWGYKINIYTLLKVIYDFESTQLSPREDAQEWADLGLDAPLMPDDENYRLHVVNCVSVCNNP